MNEKSPKFFIIVAVIVLLGLFVVLQFVLPNGFYSSDILGSIGQSLR